MFKAFGDIDKQWVNRDFHVHTKYTDGQSTIGEVVRRAEETGLSVIAFTEHVRASSGWFEKFAAEVREHAKGAKVEVLVGCEARIADFEGNLDISPEIRALCDVVLASVHRFPGPDGEPVAFSQVPKDEFAGIEHRLAGAFLDRGGAAVLAHPGGMSMRYGTGFPAEMHLDLMARAKKAGIAYEINASYYPDFAPLLPLFREIDPTVSVGSDAHKTEEVARCRDRLSALLWP